MSNRIRSHDVTASQSSMARILLVLLAFCEKNLVRYVRLVISMFPVVGIVGDFILPTLYIGLIILCLKKKTKIGLPELIVPTFIVLAIVLTCAIYPQNTQYIIDSNNFWNTIFPCLRWFIVGLAMIPDEKIMDLLGISSCLAILVETAFLLLYMIPNNLVVSDDMSRAYQLLPNIMLAFNYAFNKKKTAAWVFSCVGIVYLLSLGTRGPFLILLAYIAIKLIRINAVTTQRKVLLVLGIACVCGVVAIPGVYVGILKGISSFIAQLGLSTRVIDHMIEGTVISYVSGRDAIYEVALQKIAERPFLGYGVYGEWPWNGWNIHNMYIELLIHYGVVVGSLLLFWGVSLVGRAYFKTQNPHSKDMILIFSCFVFLRGLVGGSYLMFSVFFLVGFCIKELRRIKRGWTFRGAQGNYF